MSVAERIEQLCRICEDAEFNGLLHEAGAEALLGRILSAVHAGASGTLTVEADLDALDDAFAAVGVDGLTTSVRAYQKLEFDTGHPRIQAWVCPLKACSRSEPVPDAQSAPRCSVAAAPLELLRTRA